MEIWKCQACGHEHEIKFDLSVKSKLTELKEFIHTITLELQQHRSKTPEQLDAMFQKAYRLYSKYKVENT